MSLLTKIFPIAKLLPVLKISNFSTQGNAFLNHIIPNDPAFLVAKHQILSDNKQLSIKWQKDDTSNHFHAMWLRHQCHCEVCTHLSSGQRFQDPAVLRSPVTIKGVRLSDDRVQLEWRNAEGEVHHGFLPLKWLHLQRGTYHEGADSEPYKLTEIEYGTILNSEQGLYEYLYKLNTHGVVQVYNAPRGGVTRLADAIAHRYDSMWGREFEYGLKIDPTTLAYSNKALYYHSDLTYMLDQPGLAYLHCLQYDECVQGGVLSVKDGFKIAEAFRLKYPEHFDTLSRVRVKFVYISFKQGGCYIRETTHLKVNPSGELEEVSWSPNIQMVVLDTTNGEDMQKYAIAYDEFNKFIDSFPERVDIEYKAGIMAVFHNTRMIHMRDSLNLNGGVRHIHGCYTPIDEYRSKLRYLSFKLGYTLPKRIW